MPILLTGASDAVTYLASARFKPAPIGSSWTITVAAAAWGGGASITYPIILRDSNTGKVIMFNWYSTLPTTPGGSTSTLVGNPSLSDIAGGGEQVFDTTFINPPFSDYLIWYRIVNTGGNIQAFFGPEGVLWQELTLNGDQNSFLTTIDQVGFGILRANSAAFSGQYGNTSCLIWSWVES